MCNIELSEIQIIPIKPYNGLVAFCSFVVNGFLFVGDVAIYNSPGRPEGFRLVFPDKVLRTGKKINVVHPITREAGDLITKTVVKRYRELQRKICVSDDKSCEEVVTNDWKQQEQRETARRAEAKV